MVPSEIVSSGEICYGIIAVRRGALIHDLLRDELRSLLVERHTSCFLERLSKALVAGGKDPATGGSRMAG